LRLLHAPPVRVPSTAPLLLTVTISNINFYVKFSLCLKLL